MRATARPDPIFRDFGVPAMIVSASHRTDIPAFYGAWFHERLEAGFARAANPFGGKPYTVALGPAAVDGFVFWTRNARPFLSVLAEVRRRGFPFVIQHTLTAYPRGLDRFVPEAGRILPVLERIAGEYGPDALVWRYDPVVLSGATPAGFHRENFARLARALEGRVDEVVFSFVHPYAKTRRNLAAAGRRSGFTWRDPPDDEKRSLLGELAAAAAAFGMRPTLCAQPHLAAASLSPARCVDAGRLSRVAAEMGHAAVEAPEHGNREGCACHRSRDIGAYETCPHGCAYCYAVASTARAARNYRAHRAVAPSLAPTQA